MTVVGLTLDIDWAPDFVIDAVAEELVTNNVAATWFVTHTSPAVDRLREHPALFELGIHPNLFPGSTHGRTVSEILRHCLEIVPDAKAMRTHGLNQSSAFFIQVGKETGIECDVSLFLPRATVIETIPYWAGGRCLRRLPYVWEDDYEMECGEPIWEAADLLSATQGPVVVDLHPIHVALNSRSMEPYESLKREARDLTSATAGQVETLRHAGFGTHSFLRELVAQPDVEFATVSNIVSHRMEAVP